MQTLSLTAGDSEFINGKKVLLVDDVFASGGTYNALEKLVVSSGAEVAARAVIAIEEGAIIDEELIYLFVLPVTNID